MQQVQLFCGLDKEDLQQQVNKFLSELQDDALKDLHIDMSKFTAVIQYAVIEKWQGRICSECKYWDDGGSTSSVSGLCHECGCRRRFNNRACEKFQDVRD